MTLIDVLDDKSPIQSRSTETLSQQLSVIRNAKFWVDPYFAINHEIQARATRKWVSEDVFGTADWRK
jgi:hypothetical protein